MSALKPGLIGAGVFGGYHAGKTATSEQKTYVGVFEQDQDRSDDLAD